MVAQQPVQRGSFSLGHARTACIVILLHRCRRACPFEVVADVGRGHAAHHALNPIAVAIVNKRGRGRPADRGHAVLGVIGVAGGAAVNLLRHVPIGIVAEGCASCGHHSTLLLRSRFHSASHFYPLIFKTASTG